MLLFRVPVMRFCFALLFRVSVYVRCAAVLGSNMGQVNAYSVIRSAAWRYMAQVYN